MMRRHAATLLLAACSGGYGPDAGDGGGSPDAKGSDAGSGCTITLSGAITGSVPCTLTAGKRDNEPMSIFAVTAGRGGDVSSGSLAIFVAGELTTRSYGVDDLSMAAFMLTTTDSRTFAASFSPAEEQGTFGGLTLSSLSVLSSEGGMKLWTAHGTLDVTLVGTSAGGMVMMAVRF